MAEMIKLYDICNVPINKILHDDKPAYVKEGHGGKQVHYWPVYRFYRLYHTGKKKNAKLSYINWYIDQYVKYAEINKSQGGMKGGSLDRLVKRSAGNSGNEDLFRNAVAIRVQQRFQLFESISFSGYRPDHNFPVAALKLNGNQYKLISGHHRAAILAVLEYDSVPDVLVFSGEIMNLCYRIGERIKRMTKDRFS